MINAAAVYSLDPRQARKALATNARATEIVLEAAVRAQLDPIVHVSSYVALLPSHDVLTPDSPVGAGGPAYPRSKAQSELIARRHQCVGAPALKDLRDLTRHRILCRCRHRCRYAEALDGPFGAHHAVIAARILAHLDFLDTTIADLDAQIADRVASGDGSAARLLREVPGIDRAAAEVIIAETGADMSRFPSPARLASWAGMCPGNHQSAGKRRMVATRPGNPWLRRTLIGSARAAARTKGSYFGAQYRQIARRRGPNKAAVAVAHSLLDVTWHMLTTGEVFADLGHLPPRQAASGPSPGQPAGKARLRPWS